MSNAGDNLEPRGCGSLINCAVRIPQNGIAQVNVLNIPTAMLYLLTRVQNNWRLCVSASVLS